MFVHRLALAIALLAGLIGSQGPEFAQQYRQRLGGAVDELNRIVAKFDAEVQRENLTPAEGLSRLDQNADPLARQRGEAMAETIDRARRVIQEKKAPEPASAKTQAAPRTKLLVRSNNRNFIVDASDVIYATIDNGLITLVTTNLEGQSNYRTIEDLQANLDRDLFWRVHRSYLVNINRIKEVVPWFKSSYQLRLDDRKHTEVPVSRVQTRRLRELFKL